MRRGSLSKQDIIAILSSRERGSWEIHLSIKPVGFSQLEPLKKLTVEQIMQVVTNTNRRMLEIAARRMLIPGRTGRLISVTETRRMLYVAGRELIRSLPEQDQARIDPLIRPIADFLQGVVSVWYADSTYEDEWEYIEAVHALASAHMLDPLTYLRQVPGAQEHVIRWIYDPDRYRSRRLAPLDAIHPERLERQLVECVRECERALHVAYAARMEERLIRAMVPSQTRFWRVRADKARHVDDEIRRIWHTDATDGPCEA